MAKREDNLKPFDSNQNREEAKKNGRKGGKRSGEVRREKANFKRILTDIYEGKPSKPLIEILKKSGIESPEKLSYLEAIIAFGALKTHSSKTGLSELTRFLEFSRDTLGQRPTDKMELTQNDYKIVVANEDDKNALEDLKNSLKND